MKHPHLADDGSTIELDLHGARVDEAIDLVQRAVLMASERGRSTLRVIHGSSTSDPRERNRTIKHAILDALEEGMQGAESYLPMEGATLVSLAYGSRPDPRPITLSDFR